MSGKLMGELFERQLTKPQMIVALAFAEHGTDDGSSIYPSLGKVAWMIGKSDRHVRTIVRELEELGLLVKVAEGGRRGDDPTEYRMDTAAAASKPPRKIPKRRRRSETQTSDLDETQVGNPDFRPEPTRSEVFDTPGRKSVTPRSETQTSAEPSIEPSTEPPFSTPPPTAEAKPLPPEARAKPAHGGRGVQAQILKVFEYGRTKLKRSAAFELTDQRARAIGGRLERDHFTVGQLKKAIDGAAEAKDNDDLDYPHHATELYQVMVDREHVLAWINYHRTGDPYVLSEMFLTEQPRTAA